MKRALFSLVIVMASAAAACGGGDKKSPTAEPAASTEKPAASATAKVASKTPGSSKTATAGKSATPGTSSKSEKTISGLFGSLFSSALSGAPDASGAGGLGEGDPSLAKYLPANSDLPDGYTPQGQFNFRAPDGISDSGGIDVSAEIASTGDPSDKTDFSKAGMLMAMVLKPDDLQSLGEAFDSIKSLNEQDLKDTLAEGAGGGDSSLVLIKNVKVLEAPGLGDGNVGFQMTIDLSAIASIFSGLAGDATPAPDAPDLSKLAITMRIYLFARGDYAGGILRMAFSDSLANDVDEVALAKIIDNKLKGAP